MVDNLSIEARTRNMASVKGKDTKPELTLRKALHGLGFRYNLHSRNLPGRPDIVLPKYKAVLFVHGCFWHQHENCHLASMPASRTEFWAAKFEINKIRDAANKTSLLNNGWRVGVIWGCALKTKLAAGTIAKTVEWLHSDKTSIELGQENQPRLMTSPCSLPPQK